MTTFKDLRTGLVNILNGESAENRAGEDNFNDVTHTSPVHRTVKVAAFSGDKPENLSKQNKLIEKLLDITDPLINNDTTMSVEFDNSLGCTKVTIEYYFNDLDCNIIAYAEGVIEDSQDG